MPTNFPFDDDDVDDVDDLSHVKKKNMTKIVPGASGNENVESSGKRRCTPIHVSDFDNDSIFSIWDDCFKNGYRTYQSQLQQHKDSSTIFGGL